MKIALTGHRPNKLWGYDLRNPSYIQLGNQLLQILSEHKANHIITGMALGADQLFALVGFRFKAINPNLIIEGAIPCANQDSRWADESKKLYQYIMGKLDTITYVSEMPYNSYCMQKRNEYMVDNCNLLIAVWDGTAGGTGNCVRYAESKGKRIIRVNPKN